jgi:hypothetical protein
MLLQLPTWIVLSKAAMLPHATLGEVNASNLHIVQGEGQEVRGPLSLIQTRIYIATINHTFFKQQTTFFVEN